MRILFRAALTLLALVPITLLAEETLAERKLRQLVNEEKRILEGSQRADGSYDEDLLESRYQGLVHRYDAFIQENPEFAAGFVAYGRALERIGEEKGANAMYLRANRIDPNIPLVKNQLGNYLVERGDYADALPYYLAAIELDPGEPLYHYQLGSLLHHFQEEFVSREIFERQVLDEKMLEAFREAARLAPRQVAFSYRYAEAFYDLEHPQWDEALRQWQELEKKVSPGVEQQAIFLHQAEVLAHQGEIERASALLEQVKEPVLRQNRQTLIEKLETAAEPAPAAKE